MKTKTYERSNQTKNGVKRLVFCGIAILLEFAFLILTFTRLNKYATVINVSTRAIAVIIVLILYSQNKTSTLKMPWIILISTMPVFGVAFYLLVGLNKGTYTMRKRYRKIDSVLFPLLPENEDILSRLKFENRSAGSIAHYIARNAGYPVYSNTDVVYYSSALDGLHAQLEEISKAEKFIFMEYHAIENKEAWHMIQEKLEEKVKKGVEVRVFYDDLGSISFINRDFAQSLEASGIKCRVFNPFMPGINMFLNNRDHRKITVIDGRVGFTGGYNIANEYFNFTHPYGNWKDTGIRIEGDAVRSLTVTFLEMWNAVKDNDLDDDDFSKYLPEYSYRTDIKSYVQPYADIPTDNEQTGENVYISMLNKSEKYCWFITPYLIITDEMISAMSLAAKRGVDIRIITPGIPDKKMVYQVTRSFYPVLVKNGIRIYEWTPGFCHAKMCVADDCMATCGTINLDYRSLYHHFENGVFMVESPAVGKMKKDFLRTFSECREVTKDYAEGKKTYLRIEQLILRLFASFL